MGDSIANADCAWQVERWLLQLEGVMKRSVRDQISRAFEAYATVPREQWVQQWPGQVVIAVGQTYWTTGVHEAIRSGTIPQCVAAPAFLGSLFFLSLLLRGGIGGGKKKETSQ
jgi:hypothetical protein